MTLKNIPFPDTDEDSGFSKPPDLADMDAMAREEFLRIPFILRRHTESVVLRLAEFPDEETLSEMGFADPFELLGLYRGISMGNKQVMDTPGDVDMIYLYRRPLLDYWCETGEDLRQIIRHVLIHEIGHHFGFSDDDMERIESESHGEEMPDR